MSYIAAFAQSYLLPQTAGASDLARQVNETATEAVLKVRLDSPGRNQTLNEVSAIANEYGLFKTFEGLQMINRAVTFLGSLPLEAVQPNISADPDGEISFDWADRDLGFSVSVGPSGRLIFATNIPGYPRSGESFFGGVIPDEIVGPILHFR